MHSDIVEVWKAYQALGPLARINFLEWVKENDGHKLDYALMDEGTRKFYGSFKE